MRGAALAVFARRNRSERTHVIHVSAQDCVVCKLQRELDRGNNRGCRHIAEGIRRHTADIYHEGDAAAGPDVGWRSTASDPRESVLDGVCETNRVLCDSGTQGASGAAHEENGRERGLTVLSNPCNRLLHSTGQVYFDWVQLVIELVVGRVLARGARHSQ